MQSTYAARRAWPGPLAMALVLLGLLAMPVPAHAARTQARHEVAMAAAGWHGRAIQNPRPRPRLLRADWPKGWSAGSVGFGTGYSQPGGSDRVREVQRRLTQLGYRPGPVDGLFGPRTRAATRWFQYKHSLPLTGRVTRSTLVVLQARSDHKPLPAVTTGTSKSRGPSRKAVKPTPPQEHPAVSHDRVGVTWLLAGLLLLAALGLGVVASFVIPERRRAARKPTTTAPKLAPALPPALAKPGPVPAAPARRAPARTTAPRVVGYAMVDAEDDGADASTAALALRCAHRGWSLVEVIHDRRDSGHSLMDRPGLTYAVDTIRSRRATGLVVARIRDFTQRVADLATLLKWLADADAFLGAADHELDTSTRAGRGTAGAVIEIARWERERISQRTREDLVRGRFTPAGRTTGADITQQIAVMHEHGLSFRAIADALNLVGVAGPAGHTRWRTADVKAATQESRTS
jgi:DNA invertase Pin-like site-specific DNA recombinase/peptidoglycan hydrolase-like protein with peptidoglycan-binding domain